MQRMLVVAVLVGCGQPGTHRPDAADNTVEPIVAAAGTWTWVGIDGMRCANGNTTGIGVNLSDTSDDVFIFMAGGGACWDQQTCYTQPTSVNIADGYGKPKFDADIAQLGGAYIFQRVAQNPFKDASWIYVPYCTGDLHAGTTAASYAPSQATLHVGRTNAAKLVARVAVTRPDAANVWMLGLSAGGYGVAFDWDLAKAAWPTAKVRALGDSSQLVGIDPARWAAMVEAWKPTFPGVCFPCATDLGAMPHALAGTLGAGDRYGLLAFTQDQVLSGYFLLTGDQLRMKTLAAQAAMQPSAGQAAFVLEGTGHVMLANPNAMTSTGVTLATWVTQWATGDAAWANAGP